MTVPRYPSIPEFLYYATKSLLATPNFLLHHEQSSSLCMLGTEHLDMMHQHEFSYRILILLLLFKTGIHINWYLHLLRTLLWGDYSRILL